MGEPRTHKRQRRSRPASTPDGREQQLISLAEDYAEKQLRDGSAPAQVVTHFLKLGSSRERAEQERLRNENLLLSARIEEMARHQRIEELYTEALNAMRSYSGQEVEEAYDDHEMLR
jgi:hypothetical protein